MKRFLLYFSVLFLSISFATAQETHYINTSTGTLNNGTSKSSVWTANDSSIGLKITATDSDGKAVNAISDWSPTNKFYAAGLLANSESLSSSPTTYTLSIENEDYVIVGYSLKYKVSTRNKVTLTNEYNYSATPASTSVENTMSATGLSTKSTKFTVASSDATRASSQSVNVVEFTVSIKKEGDEPQLFTLTVGETEWATLFLDFNAAIPTDVKAYIVKADGIKNGYITLTQVTGVLPAETGVIVNANTGNHDFVASTDEAADVAGNLLEGSVADKNIEGEAYVLTNVNGEACFRKAEMSGTSWLNNANKAYLPATAANGAASYSFRFGEGTTAIENVVVENEVKAIFDLTGRKVETISAPGIYIVNGKKTLVK